MYSGSKKKPKKRQVYSRSSFWGLAFFSSSPQLTQNRETRFTTMQKIEEWINYMKNLWKGFFYLYFSVFALLYSLSGGSDMKQNNFCSTIPLRRDSRVHLQARWQEWNRLYGCFSLSQVNSHSDSTSGLSRRLHEPKFYFWGQIWFRFLHLGKVSWQQNKMNSGSGYLSSFEVPHNTCTPLWLVMGLSRRNKQTCSGMFLSLVFQTMVDHKTEGTVVQKNREDIFF